jgi:hypothetical protein
MKLHIRSARFTLSFLIGLGVSQAAAAQPSDTPAAEPYALLGAEEIVTNLVQRNYSHAVLHGCRQPLPDVWGSRRPISVHRITRAAQGVFSGRRSQFR